MLLAHELLKGAGTHAGRQRGFPADQLAGFMFKEVHNFSQSSLRLNGTF
jgi:hypothetical protein